MFCQKCGNKVGDSDTFCNQCGARLIPLISETKEAEPVRVEATNEIKGSYNKWIRVVSVFWGTIGLLGSIGPGINYYFKSGLPLVIISEILIIPISISLILLGLFPEDINTKIQIKNRYPEVVVGIIILSLVIIGIEPQPLDGGWDYNLRF